MGELERQANVLGALGLVVADRVADTVQAAGGHSLSAAAALSALRHFLDGATIDTLSQVLGLTSSGTVRLVERLEAGGHLKRGRGQDRRAAALQLTARGKRAADRVSGARLGLLRDSLAGLSPADRKTFAALVNKLIGGFVRGKGATRWICRLCDLGACGWEAGRCPVRNAAQAKTGGGPG